MDDFKISLQGALDKESTSVNIQKVLKSIVKDISKNKNLEITAYLSDKTIQNIQNQLKGISKNIKIDLSNAVNIKNLNIGSVIQKQAQNIGKNIGRTISDSLQKEFNKTNFEFPKQPVSPKEPNKPNSKPVKPPAIQSNFVSNVYLEQIGRQEERYARLGISIDSINSKLKNLHSNYNTFSAAVQQYNSITQSSASTDKQKTAALEKLIAAEKSLQTSLKSTAQSISLNNSMYMSDDAVKRLTVSLEAFLQKNSAVTSSAKNQIKGYINELQNAGLVAKSQGNKITTSLRQIEAEQRNLGNLGLSTWDTLKKGMQSFSYWLSGTFIIMSAFRNIKYGISSVYELDTALVDLKKTTTMTNEELENFYYSSNDTAKQMGVSTEEIITAASAWSRLGYNTSETATQMAKLSSQFKLISPGMTSDEATSGLVSVMKAYDIDTDNVLDGIMSKINIIGNKFALTNADIVAMLQDSVSAMKEGNNTLDETIALETAAFEITQDRNVGNGFKTVALRLRGLNEETQETDDSLKTIKGDLYDLTGISIMEDADTYKSTYQILKEISNVWDSLSDKTQAKVLEKMFGKHRANIGAAVLKNFSAAEKAMAEMANSVGNADAEMAVAMDSISYKLNTLKETGTGIAQNLFEQDEMKNILDILIKFAEGIDFLTDKAGLLPIAFSAAYTAIKRTNSGMGKTILDFIGDIGKLNISSQPKITPVVEMNDYDFWHFKKALEDIDKDPVQLDIFLKTHGLDRIEGLRDYILNTNNINQDSVNNLIQTQNYTDIAKQAHGYTGVKAAIDKYNDSIRQSATNTKSFTDILNQNNPKLANYINNLKGAKGNVVNYTSSLIGATAKTLALKAATMALNMTLGMGIGALISWGISEIVSLFNAGEEAMQKASEAASELNSDLNSLDDYKGKIIELKTALDSNTLSYEEAKSKRQDLMDIQNELIKKYGLEAQGINLITGSLEEQEKVIDRLKEKDINDWEAKNYDAIQDAKEKIEKPHTLTIINRVTDEAYRADFVDSLNKMGFYAPSYDPVSGHYNEGRVSSRTEQMTLSFENYEDYLKKIQEYEKIANDYEESLLSDTSLSDKKREYFLEQLQEHREEFAEAVRNYSESDEFKNALEVYEQHTNGLLVVNEDYKKTINEITQAQEEYNNAVVNGLSQEEIDKAAENLAKVYTGIDLDSIKDMGVRQKIEEIMETADDVVSSHIFEITLGLNDGELKKDLEFGVNSFGGIDNVSSEDILNFDINSGTFQETLGYNKLQDSAESMHISMEQLIANMEKAGMINSKVFNDLVSDPNLFKYEDQLRTLTKDQLEFLNSLKPSDGKWKIDLSSSKKISELLSIIKKGMGELEDTPTLSFSNSLKELNKFTEGFSQLDKIYADVYNKEGFDFSSLFDDKFIETFGEYKEEYKNLVDTISESPDDIEACQSAFDNLVSAWFYGQDALKNLNEENKNAKIAYLEQNGVANANAIVTTVLAGNKLYETNKTKLLSDANEMLSSEIDDASASTENNTMRLLEQSGATSETINWVMKLVAQQTIFSKQGLSVEDKINALERLSRAYGQAAFAARLASKLDAAKGSFAYSVASLVDGFTGTHDATDKVLDNVYNEVVGEFNNITAPPINYTGGSSTGSAGGKGSGGGGGKGGSGSQREHETNDEYYNYYQTKVDDLKNGADDLKEAIDETNEQIELAYKTGDTKLAKSLEAMLPQQVQQYKDYLAAGAKEMRKMAKEEIYPIVYKIAPELEGKTIDQFTEVDKLTIKERLDNEIIAQKNKVIDLENAGKSGDGGAKISDKDVKAAEQQLKVLEELYSTLDYIYNLAGNVNGEGEWSKNYREMINDQIDAIKDSLDKAIEQDEFNLSLFEGMDNQEGMLNVYLQELDKYRKAVKDLKVSHSRKNGHEKASKNGMNRNNSFIFERLTAFIPRFA